MAQHCELLSLRPMLPPERLSWGGEILAEVAFRYGAITVKAARLLRRQDGEIVMSMGAGSRGLMAAEDDLKAEMLAAALGVYEAKTAPRAPAQPPLATANIARDKPHDTPGNTGAARRHRHRAAQRRS